MSLLEFDDRLVRLLEAADDWQDPRDVVGPSRDSGVDCRALYNLCRARIERSAGEARRRLEALRDKLERPAEVQRLLPRFNGRFELLRKWLAEVGDPETAAESLEEMGRLLRAVVEPLAEE